MHFSQSKNARLLNSLSENWLERLLSKFLEIDWTQELEVVEVVEERMPLTMRSCVGSNPDAWPFFFLFLSSVVYVLYSVASL